MTPVRIQRRRNKGYDMQALSRAINGLPCVFVGRPTRFGNPFVVGVDGDAAECVRRHAEMLTPYRHNGPNSGMNNLLVSIANIEDIQIELRGKNLSCYCKIGGPCHADLLLHLANDLPAD